MNLHDRVVVVTGAGSGIGRATALAFAKRGARIAACDVDQARLDSLRAELGDRALVVARVDVSDRAQMSGFAGQVHAACPAADVVVNNAGVAVGGSFLDTSLDDWDWVVKINLLGVVHGCHFFVPNMVEAKQGGHVVNISSIFGIYPATQTSAYVATKFAVRGFSLSLRDELAPHRIGVTAICPGMIATEIVKDGRMSGQIDGERKHKMTKLFARRGLPPANVADAILAAVETNPAVRTVGRDARMLAALTRLAPNSVTKLGSTLARRFL
ncbi:MAG TPA: SDR family NAD(P)-dependent oxidoreductase [Kofleriaceae bacterium]|jgi:NADP-dependent 3-hydroxy acid dehydrogenase YdfG|nr:SDR family NAD(P)-dependent oxidoreductase [Kofleriaceae bacterium]